jgi:CheY-like chemotaxis protein
VLVVDDNDDAAATLADLLRMEGYEARTAHDGPSAFHVVEEFAPDVVLLDIGLPIMDGYEVAQGLRGLLGDRLAVIAVTGYGRKSDVERTAAAGFHAHLVKPVDPGKLLDAIATQAAEAARRGSGASRATP